MLNRWIFRGEKKRQIQIQILNIMLIHVSYAMRRQT